MLSSGRQTALLLALVGMLYYNALGNEFHYDDFHSIVHNPHIRDLGNLPQFFSDPGLFSADPRQAMYRPLLLCSYAFNYALGGLDPAGYHLVNGLLHAANATWVLLLARALGFGNVASFITALLFAVHPLNSEGVHYASSRSEVLMAFFFLGSCLAHIRYRDSGVRAWYGLALLGAALALLCKSVAVVLVLIWPLCDWLRGPMGRKDWQRYLPLALVVAAYLLFSRQLVGQALLALVRSLDVQLWTQLKGAIYYVLLGVVPTRLSADHQFAPSLSPLEGAVLCAGLLIGSLIWLVVRGSWRMPSFGLVWIATLLGPTAVVPLIVLVNEHRL